jgi:hypothetical protein
VWSWWGSLSRHGGLAFYEREYMAQAGLREVGRAVRRGERAQGAVGESTLLVQVSDQRQAPGTWREATCVPAGGPDLGEVEAKEEREEEKQGRELHVYRPACCKNASLWHSALY